MKKSIFLSFAFVALALMSFALMPSEIKTVANNDAANIEMPENVKAIVDNKCYGCHNSESKNEKGAKKLSFDKLSDLSTAKQVAKMDEVHEVIVENKMPPSKFLEKYPNKALSSEEKEILVSWAKSTIKELMK